jgi:putative ABC transport system permease protein
MRSHLRLRDLVSLSSLSLRTRRLRAALSALGVGIGVAAIVGIQAISASSQAQLLAQLDALGTNLLVVTPGNAIGGGSAQLPATAPIMIRRVASVQRVASIGSVPNIAVRRTDRIPPYAGGGIAVDAADPELMETLHGELYRGAFLNAATAQYPTTVLGWSAAQALGLTDTAQPVRILIGSDWFTVIGVMQPLGLAPELDRAALIGFPATKTYLGFNSSFSAIYVRTSPEAVDLVAALLPRSANPAHPEQVLVVRPSDLIAARAVAMNSSTALFIGLGVLALLVGGIGVANVMFISILERRNEIGLRRSLGATRAHIAAQFVAEAVALAIAGACGGFVLGVTATFLEAWVNQWTIVIPATALPGALVAALLVGGLAGLYPAIRAAQLPPAAALRTH